MPLQFSPRDAGYYMTRSQTRVVLFLLAILVGATAVIIFSVKWLPTDIRYLERITGLRFPGGISNIRVDRPREFCLSGKFRLPTSTSAEFLRRYNFTVSTNFPLNAEFGLDAAQFESKSTPNSYLWLAGRSKEHRWEFAYRQSDSCLWFVLLFPDAHGDAPP